MSPFFTSMMATMVVKAAMLPAHAFSQMENFSEQPRS